MSSIQIPNLTPVLIIDGTELFECVQYGSTKRTSANDLLVFFLNSSLPGGPIPITRGGTGATDAPTALLNLGAAKVNGDTGQPFGAASLNVVGLLTVGSGIVSTAYAAVAGNVPRLDQFPPALANTASVTGATTVSAAITVNFPFKTQVLVDYILSSNQPAGFTAGSPALNAPGATIVSNNFTPSPSTAFAYGTGLAVLTVPANANVVITVANTYSAAQNMTATIRGTILPSA